MRKRIRALDRGRSASRVAVLLVAAPAFAQETARAEVRERGRQAVRREARRGRRRSTTARRRRRRSCRRTTSSSGARSRSSCCSSLMWKFGVPGREEHGEGTRGPHPRRPRGGREGRRPRPRPRRREYHAQLADATQRGRPASSRRPARRPTRCARDLIARGRGRGDRDPRSGPRPTSPASAARRMAELRDRRRDARRSTSPSASSSATSTATPTASSSTATSTRSGATEPMADRIDVYAQALLEIAQAEGHLDEVEDELFRFARIVEGNDELRDALADPGHPGRAGASDRRGPAREPGAARSRRALVVVHRRRRPWPRPARDRRPVRRARRRRARARGRRGALGGRRSTTTQAHGSPTALGQATGKTVEVKVVVDPTVLGGLVATVGDTVIDGTVRHRLEQLKEHAS